MRILSFLLLLITGLGLALPGAYLATIGGSLYYVVAGLLILVSAFLVLRRRVLGICLYWAVLLVTFAWSLWEVGLDGWALMPRLVFLSVGALWLLWLAPTDQPVSSRMRVWSSLALIAGLVAVLGIGSLEGEASATALPAQGPARAGNPGEWTHYGQSLHGTRYSDLDQITPANAGSLQQAWVYHAGMFAHDKHSAHLYETTPLMVDGMLYACGPHSAVFALDPVTGKQLWRHETRIDLSYGGRGLCRGVSFFRAPAGTTECTTRLLVGTVDNHLIALDAKTGEACRNFGQDGSVNLSEGEGLEKFPRGWINPTSPPAIVHGTAVIGSYIIDDQSTFVPPGVIRGYDAVTGALKWIFDPGKPNDHAPLKPGETYTPSTPNAWPPYSGDEQLGLVYLPMGMGSPDFYGINRTPGTER
ncbi:MAG TPA: hypothetical protein VFA87_07015, partial [Rhizomicrobium sp.]|nr:hypothetical protein [Rhizomicrobium sp.]